MGGISIWQLLIVVVIVVLLFGTKKLSSLGSDLGASIKGFKKAVFSGLPTVELSRVVRDVVLPRPALRGVYHVAAQPIDKYALLRLVAKVYDKQIEIVPDVSLVIDRSLNAERFRLATGYVAPAWPELVTGMHEFHKLCEGEG